MPSTTLNLGRVKGSMWYTGTADSNVDIASALTSAGYTPIKLDMYLNTSNGNVYQYAPVDDGLQWTLKGNLRGAKGEGFQIKKTYASVSAMNAGYATDGLPVGSFVMISSNVEDPDNAKLYVKGETAYSFVTDFSGAQGVKGETGDKGDKGDAGTAATVQVGRLAGVRYERGQRERRRPELLYPQRRQGRQRGQGRYGRRCNDSGRNGYIGCGRKSAAGNERWYGTGGRPQLCYSERGQRRQGRYGRQRR